MTQRRWEVQLAHAVLETACADALLDPGDPHAPRYEEVAARRASARDFLSGGPMLLFWCEVADLDPDTITEAAVERFAEAS